MNIQIPSLDNIRQSIRSKIVEGYDKMNKLIEDGSVDPLYPENPVVDAAQVAASTPDKTVTVNSELLRDLLNWATKADSAAIDNVVAKAEEMGLAGPMGPEKLIDLTGDASCQQPGCQHTGPLTPGNEVPAVGSQTIPGMAVPAGPTGPLSPVMASFVRRGKKVNESAMGMIKKAPIVGADKKLVVAKEDDIIASDHEVITNPEEMGKKNPDIKPDGGQDPEGMPLDNPFNKGNTGIKEDGLEVGDSEAAAIGDELESEGGADEIGALGGPEAGEEVGVAPGGEEIAISGDVVEPVEPVIDAGGPEVTIAAPAGGMVQQLSDMQARIAELEAIIKGGAVAAPVAPVATDDDVTVTMGGILGSDDVEGAEGEEAEEEKGELPGETKGAEDAEADESKEKGEEEEEEEGEDK